MGRGANGGTTPLPEGKTWLPHCGNRQRQRNLARNWNRFELRCEKDEYARSTRERLLDAVADDPQAEFAAQHLALAAQLAADESKQDVVTVLNHLLNKFEENREVGQRLALEGAAV